MSRNVTRRDKANGTSGIKREIVQGRAFNAGRDERGRLCVNAYPHLSRLACLGHNGISRLSRPPNANSTILRLDVEIPPRMTLAVVLCRIFGLLDRLRRDKETLPEGKLLEWINWETSAFSTLRRGRKRDICLNLNHIDTPISEGSGYIGMLCAGQLLFVPCPITSQYGMTKETQC